MDSYFDSLEMGSTRLDTDVRSELIRWLHVKGSKNIPSVHCVTENTS